MPMTSPVMARPLVIGLVGGHMGKVYTFIHKNKVNTKVFTSKLQEYLDDGWEIGNWNQEELNARSGAGVKRAFDIMRENGSWDEWNKQRGMKVSESLFNFWKTADQDYIDQREAKKQMSRDAWTEDEKKLYHDKMSLAAKLDRASISPEEYHRRSALGVETKKKNGTFSESSFEKLTHELLLEKFGLDDLLYDEIVDDRYPTRCDFYIKSLDLFIELNIHPSHGNHMFNSNDDEDLKLLEELQQKNDDWSNMILGVWHGRDIEKFKHAKDNKLNYIAVYSDEFENFIDCIKENKLWSLVKQL